MDVFVGDVYGCICGGMWGVCVRVCTCGGDYGCGVGGGGVVVCCGVDSNYNLVFLRITLYCTRHISMIDQISAINWVGVTNQVDGVNSIIVDASDTRN